MNACSGRRDLPAARVIDVDARERDAPRRQNRNKSSIRPVGRRHVVRQICDAGAGERRAQREVDVVDDQPALHGDFDFLARTLEFPRVHRAVPLRAMADAVMVPQIFRQLGYLAACEVGRRADAVHVDFVDDAHRDHVALDALADAQAGIEAPAHDIQS